MRPSEKNFDAQFCVFARIGVDLVVRVIVAKCMQHIRFTEPHISISKNRFNFRFDAAATTTTATAAAYARIEFSVFTLRNYVLLSPSIRGRHVSHQPFFFFCLFFFCIVAKEAPTNGASSNLPCCRCEEQYTCMFALVGRRSSCTQHRAHTQPARCLISLCRIMNKNDLLRSSHFCYAHRLLCLSLCLLSLCLRQATEIVQKLSHQHFEPSTSHKMMMTIFARKRHALIGRRQF